MTHANHQDTSQPCQRPHISKKLSMYPSLHKENPHSARDFKQKWKVLPHYATESLKYIYSNKILYIYIHNIFSAEFQIKSNILEIKYEVPPKIDLRLILSTSTSWKQSKHPKDSSGKSPRRRDWEWGVRSDQLCAAGGVICTHRNFLSHLFLSHFSNFSLLPRPFRTIGSSFLHANTCSDLEWSIRAW